MLGENIKKIRHNKKLGLNKTAEKAGISGSYLSDIENGKKGNPSINTLEKIADALEVPLDYLTGKSAKSIIEDRLEELNITLEELSAKTNIPKIFFEELDNSIPDEGDYERIQFTARTLNIAPNKLISALSRQEPPIYKNEIYVDPKDEFTEYKRNTNLKNIANYSKKEQHHIENLNVKPELIKDGKSEMFMNPIDSLNIEDPDVKDFMNLYSQLDKTTREHVRNLVESALKLKK